MPHPRQGGGELVHAFRHPDQGPHRIAERRGFDQALERRHEPRIGFGERTPPATSTANPPLRQRRRVQVFLAAVYCRTGEPGDLRDNRQTASTSGPHLCRCEQAPPPLVEMRADRVPSQPNGGLVDHATDVPLFAENRNPQDLSQSDARPPDDDSVIVRNVLRPELAACPHRNCGPVGSKRCCHATLGLAQIGVPAQGWQEAFALIGAIIVGGAAWTRMTPSAPAGEGAGQFHFGHVEKYG